MYLAVFDEFLHLVNQAWIRFECGDYADSLQACKKVEKIRDVVPGSIHYLYAGSYAGLGDGEKALLHLEAAVDGGWDDMDTLLRTKEFNSLHNRAEWQELLQKDWAG